MYFSSNIKLLRKRKNFTQSTLAETLKMKRPTLGGYESQVAQPSISALITISDFFNIAVDTLIKVDLRNLRESQLSQLENGFDVYIKGSGLRVLVSTVDAQNRENIELVPEKAKAGYVSGYADPEYISDLPTFQLPFLSKEKKYRTFQVSGDSMLPIPNEAWVTGEFVLDWSNLKNGTACIVVTSDEGVVFKIIENKIKDGQKFILHSLNTLYEPYDISPSSIKEIWAFNHYISESLPEINQDNKDLNQDVANLQHEIIQIKKRLGWKE